MTIQEMDKKKPINFVLTFINLYIEYIKKQKGKTNDKLNSKMV